MGSFIFLLHHKEESFRQLVDPCLFIIWSNYFLIQESRLYNSDKEKCTVDGYIQGLSSAKVFWGQGRGE